MTQPNGVVTEYSYDAASQLTGMVYKKSGVTLGNLSYEYDAAGRRFKMGGSLAQVNLPTTLSTTAYNDANHQTTFGSSTLTYDLNGNLTSDGAKTYTWNARNQLTAISGGGVSASFAYDAVGRRKSKTLSATTTSFLYDGANVVQEQVSGSASANLLTGGIDRFFSRTDASGTTTPLVDGLGSVIGLTDSSGAIQTQYSYEPFGKASASGTSSSNPQKYTGREDDGTGLFYYRARYYSPDMQRFISEDPIGLTGGDINLFAYVGNSPTMGTDPSGLEQFTYTSDGKGVQNPQMWGRNTDILSGRGKCNNGLYAAAIAVALADGPEPGPADLIALGLLFTAAAVSSRPTPMASDGGGKILPFPDRRPKEEPVPPPPPPSIKCSKIREDREKCYYVCTTSDGRVAPFEFDKPHPFFKCPPTIDTGQ